GVVGRRLSPADREGLLADYHRPYRQAVCAAVEEGLRRRGAVTLLSVHSFTPRLKGVVRNVDVAVLYDPARPAEGRLADAILAPFAAAGLRVRRNYPYRGVSDGVATALRRRFDRAGERLVPVEIEYSHRLFDGGWRPARLAELTAEGIAAFKG
ncbi:MAG: N-formylglutamate amidohydrolase, partial [Nitrospinae bacterium]|nr:N-formylglutamate amidohydrolase [Nitrospinota bacterium]